MTSTLDSRSLYAGVMERAEIIAEASAQGPVTKVLLSKWARSEREPGRLITNAYIFAVYYKRPEDDRRSPDRMAPVSLEVTADELRAINSN